MTHTHVPVEGRKRIALVAHDNLKQDQIEWAEYNIISSPLMAGDYERLIPDYEPYKRRLRDSEGPQAEPQA